jgi:UDP-glucose 4-epimerase
MQVVVTGGAGFIGANLCRRLLEDGHTVRSVDDLSSGFRSNLAGVDAEFVEADIRDVQAMRDVVRGADSVVHLAARPSVPGSIEDPGLSNDVNVNGTLTVLLAVRETGAHFVFASSSSVYGANSELPKRESMRAAPLSPYAASKLAGESYVLAFQHAYGMACLPFRLFNTYGPLQPAGHPYAAVVPAFGTALLAGSPLTVHGDGKQSRDFTSVSTVVSVLADAVRRRVSSPDPVNLAFGTRTTLLELITMLERITARTADVVHTAPRAGDVRDSQADNSALRRLFPDIVPQPLSDGLTATVSWLEHAAADDR